MAGGEGTRLKRVTGALPKPMVPLGGKPLLEHILALLRRCGVSEACVTLRYRPEVIRDYFGDGARFGLRLTYHVEEQPLGTAGGVRACADLFGGRDVLVLSGDCVCDFDLRQLMEAHRRHGSAVTMALYAHEQPLQYGIVLTDPDGRVVSFIEKPDWARVVSDLVNTGIYVVSPAALGCVPENTPFDFAKDLFPKLLETGREIRGLPMSGYWCDVGTPRAYYQCCLDALDGKVRLEDAPREEPAHPGYVRRPDAGVRREYNCRSRARLMRALSQTLMEAGADFSDGIRLENSAGRVQITPAADGERIIISAQSADPAAAAALADEFTGLARGLDAR
jgi:mannose-1-phosphate guanylyltransferase/phosphomannomutase